MSAPFAPVVAVLSALVCFLGIPIPVAQAQGEGTLVYIPYGKASAQLSTAQATTAIEREVIEDLLYRDERALLEDRPGSWDIVKQISLEGDKVRLTLNTGIIELSVEKLCCLEVRNYPAHATPEGLDGVRLPDHGAIFPRASRQDRRHRAVRLADSLHALYLDQVRIQAVRLDEMVAQYVGKPSPGFPEQARRSRVQAESAVKDRRFADAAQRYGEALKIAPWWPEGHFNRALVLAELGRFPEAIRSMRRYLALVPEAPNARQAQDQIYAWEDRAGRGK